MGTIVVAVRRFVVRIHKIVEHSRCPETVVVAATI